MFYVFFTKELKAYFVSLYIWENFQINFKEAKNGRQKRRIINPSTLKLKEIQKRINKSILNKMSIPKYIFGGAKGKDNVLNAKQHQGKKFKFITDLTNFFPSITNKMVYDMFIAY